MNMRRQFLALSLCFLGTLASAQEAAKQTPPKGLRIFYTGHSFHMFVPAMIEKMAPLAKIEGHKLVGTQGIGGSKVIQHWDRADEMNTACLPCLRLSSSTWSSNWLCHLTVAAVNLSKSV